MKGFLTLVVLGVLSVAILSSPANGFSLAEKRTQLLRAAESHLKEFGFSAESDLSPLESSGEVIWEDLAQAAMQQKACSCVSKYSCGCCAHIDFKTIHVKGCANFTVDPNADTLNVLVSYNGMVVENATISARNPPPICTGLFYVASWCTIFTNISYDSEHFGGCLRYELRILSKTILTIPVGCFYWPPPAQVMSGGAQPECACWQARGCTCCTSRSDGYSSQVCNHCNINSGCCCGNEQR